MVPDPIRAILRKPFSAQVAAFRLRLGDLVPTAAWDDMQHNAHDRGFMVAGAMKADLLADLGAAVDKAIVSGTGIEEFRRDFRDIVERHGWHGWTGEGTAKGEAWRTKVIYQTNMATSRAAGRWAQLVDGKFKYLVYQHSGAAHPRLDHLSWDGLILPFNHPFWKTHYPPNGWGCGCIVRGAHTLAGAIRVGGNPATSLPDNWDQIDAKTGTLVGIGKGWDYAPGATVAETVSAMARKSVSWPHHIAKAYSQSLPPENADALATGLRALPSHADDIRKYAERVVGMRNGAPITGPVIVEPMKTLGLLTRSQAAQIEGLAKTRVRGFDFTLDKDAVKHVLNKHGNAAVEAARGQTAVTPADFGILGRLLNAPDSVVFDGVSPEQGPIVIYVKMIGGLRYTAVFAVKRRRGRLKLVTLYIGGVSGKSPS